MRSKADLKLTGKKCGQRIGWIILCGNFNVKLICVTLRYPQKITHTKQLQIKESFQGYSEATWRRFYIFRAYWLEPNSSQVVNLSETV